LTGAAPTGVRCGACVPYHPERVHLLNGLSQQIQGKNMKDVKVDVRVHVGVDMAGVVLLLASAAMAMFFYKQNKQNKQEKTALPS
jgi:hypothetical protein